MNENAVIGDTPYQGNYSAQQVRTQGLVLQSFWWQDRIVTTLGARDDKSRSRNANVARLDSTTGLTDVSLANGGWGSWLERRGTTNTTGVVVKPVRNVSLFYNQSDSFQPQSIRLTAAQQRAFDAALAPSIQKYIAERMPIWTTLKDDQGNLWWNDSNVSTWWNNSVYTPLAAAKANQGKPRSQVREWRWALTNNYTFATGPLKDLGVGGAARWEDRASIGFRGTPDADGIIRQLDSGRPVCDKSRTYFDGWASYKLKLFNDRVGARVQLNCRNAFEGGRLQVVGVNPDGVPYNFRIIDPRQWILSLAFDL